MYIYIYIYIYVCMCVCVYRVNPRALGLISYPHLQVPKTEAAAEQRESLFTPPVIYSQTVQTSQRTRAHTHRELI